jgi:hypothetical protein
MASSAQSSRRERPIQFGKYTLLARIGGGGMGELYLAQLRSAGGFEKLVVIKRILSHLTDKSEFVDMFVAEARTAARITHPNVCQIYELGQVDGRYYMALEYLEGLPLAEVMVARKRAPQLADLRLIASLVSQTAEGLFHAHSLRDADGENAHVVHRDVNPRNIFVTSAGVAKVLEFGIVKVRGALGTVQTGAIKGSLSYLAPEQLQSDEVDCTADIFALGTLTWEAVVGRRLFKRSSDLLTWRAIVEEPIPRATKFRPDLPPELDDAIMRALARPVAERYQTAREFASAIEQSIRPLGAPLTSLAIAAEMEKAFTTELAAQRERVFAAHRRQEAERLGAEPSEPSGLGELDELASEQEPPVAEPADEWDSGANDTRVADPAYSELVARMAQARSRQMDAAVPIEPLADSISEGLILFTPAPVDEVRPDSEAGADPVELESTAPSPVMLRQPSRVAGPVALPRPSQLPSPPAPPAYVVEDAVTLERIVAGITVDSLTMDSIDPRPPRRGRRRWVVVLALALSAASGAAAVLFLNRGSSNKRPPASAEPAASSVVAAESAAPAPRPPVTPPPTAGKPADAPPNAGAGPGPGAGTASGAGAASGGGAAPGAGAASGGGAAPGTGAASVDAGSELERETARERRERERAERRERKAEKAEREAERRDADKARDAARKAERDAERRDAERRDAERRDADKARDTDKARSERSTKATSAAAEKQDGFLTINAEPYATVFVDGKKRGFTPVVRLVLAAGSHRLRLVSSGGQPDKKMRVRIVAGQELRKSVKW